MKTYTLLPGVILTKIQGVYLLAADEKARRFCPYVRELNELGAYIWTLLEKNMDKDMILEKIREDFEVPEDRDLSCDLEAFMKSLEENRYIEYRREDDEV